MWRPEYRARGAVIAAVATCVLAMGFVAEGLGDTPKYVGHVKGDREATISFKLVLKEGRFFIKPFRVKNLLVQCPAGSVDRHDIFVGQLKVRDGNRFARRVWLDPSGRSDANLRIRGRLLSDGEARGRLRYRGGFDGVGLCDSGKQRWRATA
jgi:hypothetical protein